MMTKEGGSVADHDMAKMYRSMAERKRQAAEEYEKRAYEHRAPDRYAGLQEIASELGAPDHYAGLQEIAMKLRELAQKYDELAQKYDELEELWRLYEGG